MAKLNYANRKSEGSKLAQIVAKDLRKKALTSPSKGDNSPIELHVEGKAILDDGIHEIAAALTEVLVKAHTGNRPNCRLEELHLANNGLTALGLQCLAPAVRLAGPWLKDVDLSRNAISVHDPEECLAWEQFLDAFGTCRGLRRLDLSGNNLSGPHAFEILTRVYARHPPYDPTAAYRIKIAADISQDRLASELVASVDCLSLKTAATTTHYHEGCGLRYVPYIVLRNVNMEDSGCFQLSYILSRHVQPRHLLEPLKPGPTKQLLDGYHYQSGCFGIIYTTDMLSQYGIKLLEDCEKHRSELVRAGVEEEECDRSEESSSPRDERPPTPPSAFGHMLAPRHKHGTPRRRSSMVSGESAREAAAAACRKGSVFDAESARWKLQRETIEKHGLCGVQLWYTSMRLLNLARIILPLMPTPTHTALTTNSSAAPGTVSRRKSSMSTTSRQERQDSVVGMNQTRGKSGERIWRDRSLPFRLSLELWRRIMIEAVDAQCILSGTQVDSIIKYAVDRTTLVKERENVRNPVSNQKWMVIDAMGCLTYEMTI